MLKSNRSFLATVEAFARSNYDGVKVATMETIAFQRDDWFGPKFEEIVSKFKELVDQGLNAKSIMGNKQLMESAEKAIFDRFKIKVRLVINDSPAAVLSDIVVGNNPMLFKWVRDVVDQVSVDEVQAAFNPPQVKSLGTINTEDATVSGWFSEQEAPLHLNMNILLGVCGMSPAEVTAITLHEIGHIFNAYLFASSVNTTNQVLADVARHIKKKNGRPDVEYVYKELRKIDKSNSKEVAEALCSGNSVVMGTGLFRLTVGVCKTLMSDAKYDETAFESLSDVFTARFGYGETLMAGLTKMQQGYDFNKAFEEKKQGAMNNFILTLVAGFACIAVLIVGAGILTLLSVVGTVLCFWIAVYIIDNQGDDMKKFEYDDIKMRYLRIRLQIVESIKNPTLTNAEKKILLDQISTMDAVIKKFKFDDGFLTRMANTLFSSSRSIKQTVDEQHRLEQMIANDIFIRAKQLETI